MVLARAIVYLDRLATESAGDPTLQMEFAKGYDKLRNTVPGFIFERRPERSGD